MITVLKIILHVYFTQIPLLFIASSSDDICPYHIVLRAFVTVRTIMFVFSDLS